jgi:predicted amidophosphoribosyltransferase
VITTGSTLEACSAQIKEIKGTRLWIATIAATL